MVDLVVEAVGYRVTIVGYGDSTVGHGGQLVWVWPGPKESQGW